MMKLNPKLLSEFLVGITSSFLLGAIGWAWLATLGAYGCAPLIDALFNLSGYESCGALGAVVGVLAGSFLSVFLIHRSKFQPVTYLSISIAVLIILLISISIFSFFIIQPDEAAQSLLAIFKILLILAIPNVIFILILNWKKFFSRGLT